MRVIGLGLGLGLGCRALIRTTSRTPTQQAEDLRKLLVRRVGEEMPDEDVPSALSPTVAAAPPSTLQERFSAFVMCAFTPKRPSELPTSRWASYTTLLDLFQPHAPDESWLRLGPGNPILKQLIIQWYKGHPAFVGLVANAWCKKLKNNSPQADGSQFVSFSFEYSPAAAVASVVQPSLEKGGNVRVELLRESSKQERHTDERPATRKRKPPCQSVTVVDHFEATSSALGVAREEDDTESDSTPGWRACTWVQCDRCEKWRRVHGNDELPDEWWCELNDDVRMAIEPHTP